MVRGLSGRWCNQGGNAFFAGYLCLLRSLKDERYNRETLQVKYKGKNIHQVLEMTIEEAREFFDAGPALARKLKTLIDVGLSYIRLGQSATTLSGGEAKRVTLARELSKCGTRQTLYILDEPTTGSAFRRDPAIAGGAASAAGSGQYYRGY